MNYTEGKFAQRYQWFTIDTNRQRLETLYYKALWDPKSFNLSRFVLLNHLMAVLSPRVFSIYIYRVIRISYGSSPVEEPVISNLKSQPLAEWLPDDRCLEDPWHSCWGPRSSGYDVICGRYDSTGKYGLRCCWFSRWRICITSLQFWTVVCKQAAMHDPGDSATLPPKQNFGDSITLYMLYILPRSKTETRSLLFSLPRCPMGHGKILQFVSQKGATCAIEMIESLAWQFLGYIEHDEDFKYITP